MTIVEDIHNQLCSRLRNIVDTFSHFSNLVKDRFVNEKLLQLEALRIISCHSEVIDYIPEKPYPEGNRAKVDIWFRTRSHGEFWMEVKMRATNYGRQSHQTRRNLRAGIKSILNDINRLKKLDEAFNKLILISFLPMYEKYYAKFISRYLADTGLGVKGPRKCVMLKDGGFLDLHILHVM